MQVCGGVGAAAGAPRARWALGVTCVSGLNPSLFALHLLGCGAVLGLCRQVQCHDLYFAVALARFPSAECDGAEGPDQPVFLIITVCNLRPCPVLQLALLLGHKESQPVVW